MDVTTVQVALTDSPYDVLVGPGALSGLAAMVAERVPAATRAAVVTQAGIPVEVETGLPTVRCEIGDGEDAKTLATVELLCSAFSAAGLHRGDVVVAVGGGVVTDVAGFAAAVYHRGVRHVNVATSLVGQVDAAIGGKTGVNLPEGKNLVGAFWQPVGVICDTDLLATLPPRERHCGLGEVAKCAFLDPPGGPASDASLITLPFEEQVARCIEIKVEVVVADERESGLRMILNYGHTLGHAIEALEFDRAGEERLHHGEAVAVGMEFAARLACRLGRIDEDRVGLHREVLDFYGLPHALPAGLDDAALVGRMSADKKSSGGELTFVLDGRNGVEVVRDVPVGDVLATLAEMPRSDGAR